LPGLPGPLAGFAGSLAGLAAGAVAEFGCQVGNAK
jgi:hypothetical protein